MPIELSRLALTVEPERTVLFMGAGACISSHAPSVGRLLELLQARFGLDHNGYSLREYSGIIEEQFGRKDLIETLRKAFRGLSPTGSLLNLPLYKWKSIYTTNYDTLVEQCYKKKDIPLLVYESNFDFQIHEQSDSVKFFKLHGSIDKDLCDGHTSRIILTDSDYDHTQTFREGLYDRFKADLFGANLIIIGHSLADEDIKEIANRAAEIASKTGGVSKITLLMYSNDINRAGLWEKRGFQVCFGGLDDFFHAIAVKLPFSTPVYTETGHPFDQTPTLRPITVDVEHAASGPSDATRMFNGWPASYADIVGNLTFDRAVTSEIETYLEADDHVCATILGASGLGKTTAARQALLSLQSKGYTCWEHKGDFELPSRDWLTVAKSLPKYGTKGVLFVDEAHSHLHQINALLDSLYSERVCELKVVLVSTRNHWNPRIKTPAFYKIGREFGVGRLKSEEIDKLLNLIDSNAKIRDLVGGAFSGFSRHEKRRRLVDRCESETFVCLKNIFSSEKFDDIILREYASLNPEHQDIYRIVAAMESSGIRVHRQLVIRLLGIPALTISAALSNLTDIIHEYVINEREGLYGWRGRHAVIVSILTKYKFHDTDQIISLFEKVIDSISPTFDIEIRTIRELCNIESGLPRIPNKNVQNRLLRKMMSVAPGERVPRHRLIRNLIQLGEFEKADAEIRIFEKDFGRDAPVTRYRINILVGRALETEGILLEDRLAILNQARDAALAAIGRFRDHKLLLGAYCDVGIEIYRKTADFSVYDDAMQRLKRAEVELGDPEISKLVRHYERRLAGQSDTEADIVDHS
ncbi:SIR2 family protein [Burkholderia ambifaria]|uniref:SIR2 family protein n=1 Tax=Burkholderia ambifaria TaxID=152480 RepID=UPI001ABAF3CE|nr:SIR2 family protein [Burkholderia ambifaria]